MNVLNNIAENLLSNKEWELQMRISSLEACEPETLFSNEVQELVNQALAKTRKSPDISLS
ncbi:MAG: hypothetical protein V8T12_11925 [Parabacteroides johnsonii]